MLTCCSSLLENTLEVIEQILSFLTIVKLLCSFAFLCCEHVSFPTVILCA